MGEEAAEMKVPEKKVATGEYVAEEKVTEGEMVVEETMETGTGVEDDFLDGDPDCSRMAGMMVSEDSYFTHQKLLTNYSDKNDTFRHAQ